MEERHDVDGGGPGQPGVTDEECYEFIRQLPQMQRNFKHPPTSAHQRQFTKVGAFRTELMRVWYEGAAARMVREQHEIKRKRKRLQMERKAFGRHENPYFRKQLDKDWYHRSFRSDSTGRKRETRRSEVSVQQPGNSRYSAGNSSAEDGRRERVYSEWRKRRIERKEEEEVERRREERRFLHSSRRESGRDHRHYGREERRLSRDFAEFSFSSTPNLHPRRTDYFYEKGEQYVRERFVGTQRKIKFSDYDEEGWPNKNDERRTVRRVVSDLPPTEEEARRETESVRETGKFTNQYRRSMREMEMFAKSHNKTGATMWYEFITGNMVETSGRNDYDDQVDYWKRELAEDSGAVDKLYRTITRKENGDYKFDYEDLDKEFNWEDPDVETSPQPVSFYNLPDDDGPVVEKSLSDSSKKTYSPDFSTPGSGSELLASTANSETELLFNFGESCPGCGQPVGCTCDVAGDGKLDDSGPEVPADDNDNVENNEQSEVSESSASNESSASSGSSVDHESCLLCFQPSGCNCTVYGGKYVQSPENETGADSMDTDVAPNEDKPSNEEENGTENDTTRSEEHENLIRSVEEKLCFSEPDSVNSSIQGEMGNPVVVDKNAETPEIYDNTNPENMEINVEENSGNPENIPGNIQEDNIVDVSGSEDSEDGEVDEGLGTEHTCYLEERNKNPLHGMGSVDMVEGQKCPACPAECDGRPCICNHVDMDGNGFTQLKHWGYEWHNTNKWLSIRCSDTNCPHSFLQHSAAWRQTTGPTVFNFQANIPKPEDEIFLSGVHTWPLADQEQHETAADATDDLGPEGGNGDDNQVEDGSEPSDVESVPSATGSLGAVEEDGSDDSGEVAEQTLEHLTDPASAYRREFQVRTPAHAKTMLPDYTVILKKTEDWTRKVGTVKDWVQTYLACRGKPEDCSCIMCNDLLVAEAPEDQQDLCRIGVRDGNIETWRKTLRGREACVHDNFHAYCLRQWIYQATEIEGKTAECPICRDPVTIIGIYTAVEAGEQENKN